jgi:hypothetical protein
MQRNKIIPLDFNLLRIHTHNLCKNIFGQVDPFARTPKFLPRSADMSFLCSKGEDFRGGLYPVLQTAVRIAREICVEPRCHRLSSHLFEKLEHDPWFARMTEDVENGATEQMMCCQGNGRVLEKQCTFCGADPFFHEGSLQGCTTEPNNSPALALLVDIVVQRAAAVFEVLTSLEKSCNL